MANYLRLDANKREAAPVPSPRPRETLSPLLCVLGEAFITSTFEPGASGTNMQAVEDRRAHYSNCLG